jgi:hypothetical protein
MVPSWLPRHERRRADRELYKLLHSDNCSVCGSPHQHNSRTTSGFDTRGNVAVAGECCADRISIIFGVGHFTARDYDFLSSRESKSNAEPTKEQIDDAIATYQKVVADTDKRIDDIVRRGGGGHGGRAPDVSLLDHPWKDDDRTWFKQHPTRSHRVRMPFPGEADKEVAKTPAAQTLIMLLKQVEPGSRLKTGFFLNADLLPVPDDEAVAHTLFEIAVGYEPVPPDGNARCALVEKYTSRGNG